MVDCIQLYLELTNRCNLKCMHCYLAAGTANTVEIPLKNAVKAIRQFAETGGKYLTLSGGETTLYKEWPSLVETARAMNLQTTVMTNGVNLEKYIDTFQALKVKIGLSLDSAVPATIERIRQGIKYDRLLNCLSKLKKSGLSGSVIICYTPMKLNYRDLPGLIRLMNEYEISNLYISILELRGRAFDNLDSLYLNQAEKVYFLNELYFIYSENLNKLNICISNFRGFMERLLDSGYGTPDFFDRTIRIDPAGNIFVTAYLDDEGFFLGNMVNGDLRGLWKSDKVQDIFPKAAAETFKRCNDCKWYDICQGGSAMLAYHKNKSFSKPDDWCEAKYRFLENYYKALTL
jgi:radical SAM protein with 4Fe4S-binding SPASM domain